MLPTWLGAHTQMYRFGLLCVCGVHRLFVCVLGAVGEGRTVCACMSWHAHLWL